MNSITKLMPLANELHSDITKQAMSDIQEELRKLEETYQAAYRDHMERLIDLTELEKHLHNHSDGTRLHIPADEVNKAADELKRLLVDKSRYDLFFS